MRSKYELRYLSLFYEDLWEKVLYISSHLGNPKAANDLVDAVESAILKRLPVCESFEPYPSLKNRKNLYYRIYVKNFIVFYVVLTEHGKKIMEVRRLLYKRQERFSKLEEIN
ncbi:MAG: type II toxin-antitoxin system RelE/ParE family toxin [Clostridiales bacterium]|nr:type II toxin-antitoxin system RelE/ParE family toxin [Clostridiales bacterium]